MGYIASTAQDLAQFMRAHLDGHPAIPATAADIAVNAEAAAGAHFETLSTVAVQLNDLAYQIGMATLGLGSLFACYLLFRTALVPRKLAAWGFIGYAMFALGMVLDMFGFAVGLLLTIPGGLFELVFPTWVIVKGFRPFASAAAIGQADGAVQGWKPDEGDHLGSPFVSQKLGTFIAGASLLLMAALAGFEYMVAVGGLVTYDDAAQNATNIIESSRLFRSGIVSLFIVIALDVLVAWGLYRIFTPVNRTLSAVGARRIPAGRLARRLRPPNHPQRRRRG